MATIGSLREGATRFLRGGSANTSLARHTAARRYCLERHAYWCQRYTEIVRHGEDRQSDGYHYTPQARPHSRYNVLNAIRVELERIDPVKLTDVEETRNLLILAGETAQDDFTQKPIREIDERAMAEERCDYCRYLSGLKTADLSAVEKVAISAR